MFSRKIGFFLLFSFILATLYCENQSTIGVKKPSPVILIPGAADTSEVECGIDAVPEGNKIRIEWQNVGTEEMMFYEIYRSPVEKRPFTKVGTVSFPDTSYEDAVPELNTRYYYYVVAVNDEGMKSEPSDTLSYKLLDKPKGLSPIGETIPVPLFRWQDPNVPPAHFYIIRVREKESKNYVWIAGIESQYNVDVTTYYNSDHRAKLDSLVSGQKYEWRVDIVGNEPACGSESLWIPISIQ